MKKALNVMFKRFYPHHFVGLLRLTGHVYVTASRLTRQSTVMLKGITVGPCGRALDWQSRGKGFDPPHLHHRKADDYRNRRLFLLCYAIAIWGWFTVSSGGEFSLISDEKFSSSE